jgi:hypothetical protein
VLALLWRIAERAGQGRYLCSHASASLRLRKQDVDVAMQGKSTSRLEPVGAASYVAAAAQGAGADACLMGRRGHRRSGHLVSSEDSGPFGHPCARRTSM